MHDRTSDDALARLETELRQSRTQAWDVETFLAKRHQAKIEALDAAPENSWKHRATVARQSFWELMGLIGFFLLNLIAFFWLLSGEFPLHVHTRAEQAALEKVNLVPPPLPPSN